MTSLYLSNSHFKTLEKDKIPTIAPKQKLIIFNKFFCCHYSNFTFLGSWSSHYKSWKNTNSFKILFIKYEDLENNKFDTFKKIVNFINTLKNDNQSIDEKKFINYTFIVVK